MSVIVASKAQGLVGIGRIQKTLSRGIRSLFCAIMLKVVAVDLEMPGPISSTNNRTRQKLVALLAIACSWAHIVGRAGYAL